MKMLPAALKFHHFYWLLPTVGLCAIFLGNFSGFTLKACGYIFYTLCALPSLAWSFSHRDVVMAWLRQSWPLWLFLTGVVLVSLVPGHPVNPKPVLYLFLLGLVMLTLYRAPRNAIGFLFSWNGAISLGVVIWATHAWFSGYLAQGIAPRILLWGDENENPIHTALLIVTTTVWAWEFVVESTCRDRGRRTHFIGFLLFVLLVLWIITVFQARSALLGFALYLGLKFLRDQQRWFWILGILIALGLLWLAGVGAVLLERGLSYRPEIWADALHRLSTECGWLIGCGNDHYQFGGKWPHAHSAYLSILYHYGVIVMLMFCIFAGKFFRDGLCTASRWMLVAAIGWGGVMANTNGIIVSYRLLWVYFWIPTFLAILEMAGPRLDSTER